MAKLNKFVGAQIKRTAQNCYPITRRINKINEELTKLAMEKEELQEQLDQYQAPIVKITGHTLEELVERKVTDTGKTDKWVLKYPKTIVPQVDDVEFEITPEMDNTHSETEKTEEFVNTPGNW